MSTATAPPMESDADELKLMGYQMVETHISRVFMRGDDVFKRKRPVALGFLDFSTLPLRKHACEKEVELNRRLAPGVYRGVVAMTRDASGTLCFVPEALCQDREVLDWAVHMHRLCDEDRADALLAKGALSQADVAQLACQIARFHEGARADQETARLGGYDALCANVQENFDQLAGLDPHLRSDELARLRAYQLSTLDADRQRFLQRACEGYVRDGHGDLRLEHCYRGDHGGWVIIDCIEFNDRFRFADVCADLAFLTMDLRHRGRGDLADWLAASYARERADYGLFDVLDFYESYRATVRGKVTSILAQDPDVQLETRERARAEARSYLLQALASGAPPIRQPTVFVTFGLIAAGKSTVARALARRENAVVLCADELRKELLGIAATSARHDAAFTGAYEEHMTERVYGTMLKRAAHVVASGRSVILDASFRAQKHRDDVRRMASSHAARALFVECRVDREHAMARLARRAQGPHVSDGRAEIYDAFAASFESPQELPDSQHLCLDTTRPVETVLDALAASWPLGGLAGPVGKHDPATEPRAGGRDEDDGHRVGATARASS